MDYFLKNEEFMQVLDTNDSEQVADAIYEYFKLEQNLTDEEVYLPEIEKLQQMFNDLGIFQNIILSDKPIPANAYVMPYAYVDQNDFEVNLCGCTLYSEAFINCRRITYTMDEKTVLKGEDCFDGMFNNTFIFLGVPKATDNFAINFDTHLDTIKVGPKVDKTQLENFLERCIPNADFTIEDL